MLPPAPPSSVADSGRPERTDNPGATASLVLGIVALLLGVPMVIPIFGLLFAALCAVPAILAIVFGHIGASLGRRRAGHGRGRALAGAILGYATVAIGVAVTMVLVVLTVIGATLNPPVLVGGTTHTLLYEVRGTAGSARVEYTTPSGLKAQVLRLTENGASVLGETYRFRDDEHQFWSLSAQNAEESGYVECVVRVDGEVVVQERSTTPFGTARCDYTVPSLD